MYSVIDDNLENSGGQRGELSELPEKAIPYLLQLPIPSLLNIFDQSQNSALDPPMTNSVASICLEELSNLLQTLLPLLFQPEAVQNLRLGNHNSEIEGVIAVPCASNVTAEILMAGIDRRPTDFFHRQLRSGQTHLLPGKYCLRLPPETGISGAIESMEDIEDDLANRMGLDADLNGVSSDIDKHLFDKFVDDPSANVNIRHLIVRDELEYLKADDKPSFYWVFEMDEAPNTQRWSELAKQLSSRYPEILLLSLDKQHLREERSFFRVLHKIVPRHLVNGN